MADAMELHAIYDEQRNLYVVPGANRSDGAGDVEYRFKLMEPDGDEPRYVGLIEKTWIDTKDGPLHQAFTIGLYVYPESFEQEVQNIIQQAREIAASQSLDEFTGVVEVVKMLVPDRADLWEEVNWWDEYLTDPDRVLASIDGLWTLGPEDAYSVRWRKGR